MARSDRMRQSLLRDADVSSLYCVLEIPSMNGDKWRLAILSGENAEEIANRLGAVDTSLAGSK
jgi:hypothetical protein